MARRSALLTLTALLAVGCAADPPDSEGPPESMDVVLGPADGHDLPATDIERVQVGDDAPDFTLASLSGDPVTLSGYRGSKDVVLVFYRGHW